MISNPLSPTMVLGKKFDVNGFCKEVLQALPMEFAMEAQKLVAISLEGSVG